MASSRELDSTWYEFSSQEKEKIIWRAVEEFWMLEFTYGDLQWARKQGLISEQGWSLIKEQRSIVAKFRKKVLIWEKSLKEHKKELQELKKTLTHARRHYKKN